MNNPARVSRLEIFRSPATKNNETTIGHIPHYPGLAAELHSSFPRSDFTFVVRCIQFLRILASFSDLIFIYRTNWILFIRKINLRNNITTLSPFGASRPPYKIEVVVGERVEIRDESRVLLVVFARLVAAAHNRPPSLLFFISRSSIYRKRESNPTINRIKCCSSRGKNKLLYIYVYLSRSSLSPFSSLFFFSQKTRFLSFSLDARRLIDPRDLERESPIARRPDQGYARPTLKRVTRETRTREKRRRHETAKEIPSGILRQGALRWPRR